MYPLYITKVDAPRSKMSFLAEKLYFEIYILHIICISISTVLKENMFLP